MLTNCWPSRGWAGSLLLLSVALLACGDTVGLEGVRGPDSVEGVWTGRTPDAALEMTLLQPNPAEVRGSGVLRRPGSSDAFRVEGVRDTTSVTLLLEISTGSLGGDNLLVQYRARFLGLDHMEGTLSGAGFNDVPLTLRRE